MSVSTSSKVYRTVPDKLQPCVNHCYYFREETQPHFEVLRGAAMKKGITCTGFAQKVRI